IEQLDRTSVRPWTPKQFPVIAGWIEANEKPLDLVVEGTKRPHYFSPLVARRTKDQPSNLIGALLPAVQKCREMTQALTVRAMLRLSQGRQEEAWQDLLACHRLGRHIARGGTLIEGLVGIAIDAIAGNATLTYLDHVRPTGKQVRDCLRDLR